MRCLDPGDRIEALDKELTYLNPTQRRWNMAELKKLVLDYDNFEYDYDPYSYGDAFSDRNEARAVTRSALLDDDFRQQIIDRLQEIADEYDDYRATALELIDRMKRFSGKE